MSSNCSKWTHVIILSPWGNPVNWRVAEYKPELVVPIDLREKIGGRRILSLESTYSNSSSLAILESLLIDNSLRGRGHGLIDDDTKFILVVYIPMTLILEDENFLREVESSEGKRFYIENINYYVSNYLQSNVKSIWGRRLEEVKNLFKEGYESNRGNKLEINKYLTDKLFEVIDGLRNNKNVGYAYQTFRANQIQALKEMGINNEVYIFVCLYPALATKLIRRDNNNILHTTLLEVDYRYPRELSEKQTEGISRKVTLTELRSVFITDLLAGFYVGGLINVMKELALFDERSNKQGHRILLISDITHGLNYTTFIFNNIIDVCSAILSLPGNVIDVKVMNSDPYPIMREDKQTVVPSLKIHCIRSYKVEPSKADAITNISNYVNATVRTLFNIRGNLEDIQLLYIASSLYDKLPVLIGFVADAILSNRGDDIPELGKDLSNFVKFMYSRLELEVRKVGDEKQTESSVEKSGDKRDGTLKVVRLIFKVRCLNGSVISINLIKDFCIEPGLLAILSLIILHIARMLVRRLFSVSDRQELIAELRNNLIHIVIRRLSRESLIREHSVELLIRGNGENIIGKYVPRPTTVLIERELCNLQDLPGSSDVKILSIKGEHLCRLVSKSGKIDLNIIRNAIAHPLLSGGLFSQVGLKPNELTLVFDVSVLRHIFKQLID